MEFLLWLQSIRTPVSYDIALLISFLCDKILLISIFCWLFWCVDKRKAYGLAFSFVLSGLLVQGIKIFARVPRPFVRDSRITPSDDALETATGYSFPSGHTQTAASLLGYTAFSVKKTLIKVFSFLFIFLVMLSRMVLGVHTPEDVTVSFLLTVFVVWIVKQAERHDAGRFYKIIAPVGAAVSAVLALVSFLFVANNTVTYALAHDCIVVSISSFTFFVCWYVEKRFIRFDPEATFTGKGGFFPQLAKFLTGLAGLFIVYAVFGTADGAVFDCLKYAAVFLWICCVYPICIKHMK